MFASFLFFFLCRPLGCRFELLDRDDNIQVYRPYWDGWKRSSRLLFRVGRVGAWPTSRRKHPLHFSLCFMRHISKAKRPHLDLQLVKGKKKYQENQQTYPFSLRQIHSSRKTQEVNLFSRITLSLDSLRWQVIGIDSFFSSHKLCR